MKKLSLEMLRLTSDEVLERSQMRKITGGYAGGCSNTACGGQAMVQCCSSQDYCSGPSGQCISRPIR